MNWKVKNNKCIYKHIILTIVIFTIYSTTVIAQDFKCDLIKVQKEASDFGKNFWHENKFGIIENKNVRVNFWFYFTPIDSTTLKKSSIQVTYKNNYSYSDELINTLAEELKSYIFKIGLIDNCVEELIKCIENSVRGPGFLIIIDFVPE